MTEAGGEVSVREEPAQGEPKSRGGGTAGQVLLVMLGLFAILSLVAAYAQVTDNRALLDLFDLRRWFTR